MLKDFTKADLTEFIKTVHSEGLADAAGAIWWFKPTKDKRLAIIGGWTGSFDADQIGADDLLESKTSPSYCFGVKIAINEGPYAYTEYDLMNMPILCDLGDEDVYVTEHILTNTLTEDYLTFIVDTLIEDYEHLIELV